MLVRFGGRFFIWYHSAMKRRRSIQEIIADEHRIEPDAVYWLEHIAHWHALFFALVIVLTLACIFSNGSSALAG
jgi:hypothetical protein